MAFLSFDSKLCNSVGWVNERTMCVLLAPFRLRSASVDSYGGFTSCFQLKPLGYLVVRFAWSCLSFPAAQSNAFTTPLGTKLNNLWLFKPFFSFIWVMLKPSWVGAIFQSTALFLKPPLCSTAPDTCNESWPHSFIFFTCTAAIGLEHHELTVVVLYFFWVDLWILLIYNL